MQEVKRPKKPLIYFYVAMILAILVLLSLHDVQLKQFVSNAH